MIYFTGVLFLQIRHIFVKKVVLLPGIPNFLYWMYIHINLRYLFTCYLNDTTNLALHIK